VLALQTLYSQYTSPSILMVTEFTKGIPYLPLQPCLSHYAYVELVKLPLQAPQLYAVWGLAQLLSPVLGPKLVFRVGVVYTMLMALAPAYPFPRSTGTAMPPSRFLSSSQSDEGAPRCENSFTVMSLLARGHAPSIMQPRASNTSSSPAYEVRCSIAKFA
jgi:hypothetical protein